MKKEKMCEWPGEIVDWGNGKKFSKKATCPICKRKIKVGIVQVCPISNEQQAILPRHKRKGWWK